VVARSAWQLRRAKPENGLYRLLPTVATLVTLLYVFLANEGAPSPARGAAVAQLVALPASAREFTLPPALDFVPAVYVMTITDDATGGTVTIRMRDSLGQTVDGVFSLPHAKTTCRPRRRCAALGLNARPVPSTSFHPDGRCEAFLDVSRFRRRPGRSPVLLSRMFCTFSGVHDAVATAEGRVDCRDAATGAPVRAGSFRLERRR